MAIEYSVICLSDPEQVRLLESMNTLRAELSSGEQEELFKRKRPEAISEFLATRWAARKLAIKVVPDTNWENWRVAKQPDGSPFLQSNEGRCLHVSISHKYPWIAVAVSDLERVGIDVEKTPLFSSVAQEQTWIRSIASTGFATQELDSLGACNALDLMIRWTQKEAIAKATSRVGLEGLRMIDTTLIKTGRMQDETQLEWSDGGNIVLLHSSWLDQQHFMTLAWKSSALSRTKH